VNSNILFFLLGIAYCPAVTSMISNLVKDKEFKQREGMAMMGLSTLTYYTSYFCYRLVIAVVQALVMSWQMYSAIFTNSNYVLVLAFFLIMAVATLTFSFMVSSIFDSSRNGAIVGTLMYFGSLFLIYTFDFYVQPNWQIVLGCFFPIV
jgi:ATP-binding cassette subfamily A (ABC1) protein 3